MKTYRDPPQQSARAARLRSIRQRKYARASSVATSGS
jgi:hypothetical protein